MHNSDVLQLELQKLGLTEKEAKVYLASLEMGHTSIQEVARRVGMSRPTAYRIYESLEKKGLMQRIKKDHKKIVAAGSPDELLGILRSEKRKIEEKEREFLRIISLLQAKYHLDSKNEIKEYTGKEGKKLLLEDFSVLQSKEIFVVISSESTSIKRELSGIYNDMRKRLGRIEVKELHCGKETSKPRSEFIERKFVSKSSIPLPCPEILIIADNVMFLQKNKGFQIEQEDVVRLFRNLFSVIWQSN